MSVSNKISRLYIMAYPVVISDLQFCVTVCGEPCVKYGSGSLGSFLGIPVYSMLNLIIAASQFFFFCYFNTYFNNVL